MKQNTMPKKIGQRICSIAFTLLISVNAHGQMSFDSTKVIAVKEHKKILLYFSGSDWCAPCIKFKNTFINAADFQRFSRDSLLLINADFPRKKANQLSEMRNKENEWLADKYNPGGSFPYILLLNGEGAVLKKWEALPKEPLSDFIEEIRN